MYRYSNGQISLADFKQPVGMNLKESNRWVKKAQTIPWLEIEKRYATLFTNRKGNVAKPLRLALGACIIQAEYGFSDEETALQIQENPYLQYFCGYPGYDDEMEMSRNVQSGNTQNLKSMVIQRSFPKWSVAERRKTAAASDQAAVCACAHSRYFAGGSPSGLRV